MTSTPLFKWEQTKKEPYESVWERKIDEHTVLKVYDDGSAYHGCELCYCAVVKIDDFSIGGVPRSYTPKTAQDEAEKLWERFQKDFQRREP
jgi:hypothetical protein